MSLADLMQDAGISVENLDAPVAPQDNSVKFDASKPQDLLARYRPQLDGNYNLNPMIQEKNQAKDEATAMIESTMDHADAAAGLTKTTAGLRIVRPHQDSNLTDPTALGKGRNGGANTSFGKPRNVSRKDLYKLNSNAAKAVSAVRQLGFSGTIHGFGQRPNPTDHDDGNAADFMVGKNKAAGNKIARYFISNRGEHNVKYVIWRQRIASASTGWKWKKMEDRGSSTANHMDHPHVSFY